ncbi:hypothetical protein BaRGS_00033258, partial [Batillaria attramentaria]
NGNLASREHWICGQMKGLGRLDSQLTADWLTSSVQVRAENQVQCRPTCKPAESRGAGHQFQPDGPVTDRLPHFR